MRANIIIILFTWWNFSLYQTLAAMHKMQDKHSAWILCRSIWESFQTKGQEIDTTYLGIRDKMKLSQNLTITGILSNYWGNSSRSYPGSYAQGARFIINVQCGSSVIIICYPLYNRYNYSYWNFSYPLCSGTPHPWYQ